MLFLLRRFLFRVRLFVLRVTFRRLERFASRLFDTFLFVLSFILFNGGLLLQGGSFSKTLDTFEMKFVCYLDGQCKALHLFLCAFVVKVSVFTNVFGVEEGAE